MERPIVLLAMAENREAVAGDLTRAGFESITNSQEALSHLAAGGRVDLAVIDCDLPAETTRALYAALHGATPVPTLLLFGDDIPEFAITGGTASTMSTLSSRSPATPSSTASRPC